MNDERLRRLLDETVEDVHPTDRLEEILTAAHAEEAGRTRRTYVVAVAAAAATALVLGTVALAGGVFEPDTTPGPAGRPPATAAPDPTEEPSDSGAPGPQKEPINVAVYWLGDTPQGVRLYREFQDVPGITELETAVSTAISGAPEDPDYRTVWPDTKVVSATLDGDLVRIELDTAPDAGDAPTPTEGAMALEQVVRTAQAAVGARVPVQFMVAGNPVAEVFGQPTSEPLTEGEWSRVLSLVSLSDPAEGTAVSDDVLPVAGAASSFEATVPWRILRDGTTVENGFFTADGWGDGLHPFGGEIRVADLPPGDYVLEVSTSDPSGGAEGPGPFRDTRTFEVR